MAKNFSLVKIHIILCTYLYFLVCPVSDVMCEEMRLALEEGIEGAKEKLISRSYESSEPSAERR